MPSNRRAVRQYGLQWGSLGIAVVALILATPFALDFLAPKDLDWGLLSNISQTYGAVSVFVSAAALIGVALSLVYQARQTHIQNEEAHRSAHRELVLLTLSDPAYQVCWEPPNTRMTEERWRQLLVANLIVSMWSSDYKLGLMDDRTMLAILSDYFRGEIGRAYWHNSGPSWHAYLNEGRDGRQRRFVNLAEKAYTAAVATGPPLLTRDYFEPPSTPASQ
ncbi:DUF6082 family protein [Streptomyces sp. NBC_01549]|uniref:DUF6082 family protein n=1 Tax=Streptomyces sp. NBC_01549 TaxID=2975874 RepID=UPI002251ADF8|nr:DUF6082 family protein [Streptomyces sp. NBC_01549]MCX4588684.1 DUF6082 family protein [Streptomyces sp. NBC_01549]